LREDRHRPIPAYEDFLVDWLVYLISCRWLKSSRKSEWDESAGRVTVGGRERLDEWIQGARKKSRGFPSAAVF
jgi:hypothetical protein